MPDLVPAAPAQPSTPGPVSAAHAAVVTDNFSDYHKARSAERSGRPLPSVPVPPASASAPTEPEAVSSEESALAPALPTEAKAPPAAPAPPREVSKRQQVINDYERRIAEQNERIARLEGQLSPRRDPHTPAEPAPAPTQADYQRYLAHPDAPKLDTFDTYDQWAAALAVFIADQRYDERQQADRTRAVQETNSRYLKTKSQEFGTRLQQAATADPDFLDKIPPQLVTAVPVSSLSPEARAKATFANIAAEVAFWSEDPAAFLMHLHAHQDETLAIAKQPPQEWMRRLTALDGRLSASRAPSNIPSAEPPRTLTGAPPPPQTLGTKPAEATNPEHAAAARNDFRGYHTARNAARLAAVKR